MRIGRPLLQGYNAAVVIFDRGARKKVTANPGLAAVRLPPCSTGPWYRWDGVERGIEGWNHDLTLRQAFAVSAVPAFQGLARQIGPVTMPMSRLCF